MLPRPHRLSKKKDVERVSRTGRPVFASLLTLRALPNRLPRSRFAVVAGLKVSKHATVRNLVKRRIREALRREHLPAVSPGWDVAVYAKPNIVGTSYRQIADMLGSTLRRAGILLRPQHNQGARHATRIPTPPRPPMGR